jgi:aldehyde dehydrogenase (NAD+)
MNFLQALQLTDHNLGACSSATQWYRDETTPIASINPTTEMPIASVIPATAATYEKIIATAGQTFSTFREWPLPKRGEVVRRFGELLREKKAALAELISVEVGKIRAEALGEVQEMIDMADLCVGLSRTIAGQTLPSERAGHRIQEHWHPLGVVGVISSFNFPVAVWSWNAFLAAVTGNVVVWKPSNKTPLTAIAVQHIANQVMQEFGCEGVFSLFIPETDTLSAQLVADKRLPLISFTGSTQVGRIVSQAVAARLGRSLLELGGNNALIVDESADLNVALPAIVFGAVGTAGQRCTSTRRLIVHASLRDKIVTALIKAYGSVRIGDPLDDKTLMGPLIDNQAIYAYQQALVQVRASGGEVLYGGNRLARPGFFVEPTLVLADNQWDIVQQETFAPILYIMTYENFDEAIRLNNAVPQGLSSALFTQNLGHSEQFLSAVGSDCGLANINTGTSGAEIGGAFGGEKDTGGGREAGSDAWKVYVRRQTSVINRSRVLPLAQGVQFLV